jgi:predicted permease
MSRRLGLLFTEMGKESSAEKLREYWILPVFTLSLTFLSILYAFIGVRIFKIAPRWMYPAAGMSLALCTMLQEQQYSILKGLSLASNEFHVM